MNGIDPLRLYAPRRFAVEGMSHIPILYPFWGIPEKKSMPHVMKAHRGHGLDERYFALVEDPGEAEYFLLPHDYWRMRAKAPERIGEIAEEAMRAGKPLLIDASSDHAGIVNVLNARVLRINQYRFDLPAYEVTMPIQCEDLLEEYREGKHVLRPKRDVPSVGFVGWARLPFPQRMRSLAKEIPLRLRALLDPKQRAREKGVFWRERALKAFAASSRIERNFIVRDSYSGHLQMVQGDLRKNREEYIDNLDASDYGLVVRGDPNIATRFYEVLSMGRIPLLLDTYCVLPLSDLIDYREFTVFLPQEEVSRGPEILAEFHASLSPEKFEDMQKKARDAYETYLRFDSFTPHLVRQLRAPVR